MEKYFAPKAKVGKAPDREVELAPHADVDVGINYFNTHRESEELFKVWREQYWENPATIFSEENIESLGAMSLGQRLCYLGWASRDLRVTPDLIAAYLQQSPQDVQAIEAMFKKCNGHPTSSYEFYLFSLAAPYFSITEKYELNLDASSLAELRKTDDQGVPVVYPEASRISKAKAIPHELRQYLEMAERRNEAPEHLLDNFDYRHADGFKDFGAAGKQFFKLFDEASELARKGDRFLKTDHLFGGAYRAMPDMQKVVFLQKCLSEIQFAFVFEEAFNSSFTRERVQEDNKQTREPREMPEYMKNLPQPIFFNTKRPMNVAHSMLFHTFQPSETYNAHQARYQEIMNSTAEIGGDIEEYPFHRLALAIINELATIESKDEKAADVLVDFWNKNRNPIFANATARALSAHHPERAAGKLMGLVRADRTPNKNAIAAILYRIEFGRIGISASGVRYLEREYDLAEFNDPKCFVERLTAQGDIGIFKETELIGHFNVGDLTTDEKIIRAAVLEFTYDTLFTPRADETPEERARREKILVEFKQHYFDFAKSPLFKNSDVQLNNLSFKEQGWILHFYETADERTRERLQKLIKVHGESGLRACLALEHGEEFRETILAIGEKLPREAAGAFFNKYGQIMDAAFTVGQEAAQLLGDRYTLTEQELQKLYQQLSSRGRDLLVQALKEADPDPAHVNNVLRRLEQVHSDILLFAAVFKEAAKAGDVSLEDIRGTELKEAKAGSLSNSERQEMFALFERNHAKHEVELRNAEIEEFKEILTQLANRFYILKHNDKIIAFAKFSDLEPGMVHFGSFNVDETAQRSAIGSALFDAALRKEGARNEVVLFVDANDFGVQKLYLEKFGFEKTGESYPFGGGTCFKLRRPADFAARRKAA